MEQNQGNAQNASTDVELSLAASALPTTQVFKFEDPDPGGQVEFRLTYRGPLKAEGGGNSRTKDKQKLRKHFHRQMRELWMQHSDLRAQSQAYFYKSNQGEDGIKNIQVGPNMAKASNVKVWVEHVADDYVRCGGRFVPLIREANGLTCALDILFLRRDAPGGLIVHGADGGDIDNRIKTLLDGLKMPKTVSDLGGLPIDHDESPFYCLLEDDRYITSLSVTTDRLLTPLEGAENMNDVHLVIRVTVTNPGAIFAGNKLV